MWTYVDFLNFGKKGTLLEVLKNEVGGGKKREIRGHFEFRPRRRSEYTGMGFPKRCTCPYMKRKSQEEI
jgi:hypothetical protein